MVVAAHHIQLDQRVALKLMLVPSHLAGQEAVARFVREARAAARITSEHVARVYDVGALDGGEPFIAMEYLEGQDLGRLLETRRALEPEEAIDYLLQACVALAEAHGSGIVHRDLKPANLFLVQRVDGRRLVKVLDFGISKMTGGGAQSGSLATRTSALMGSPLYMSPEQMSSSKAVDARSDIWALGVVLYEMLGGAPPFQGDTLPQVCAMVMAEPPRPLAETRPGLHPALYAIVARCLEKQPAARFQNVAELAHALAPFAPARSLDSISRITHVQGVVGQTLSSEHLSAMEAPAVSAPKPATHATWAKTDAGSAKRSSALWVPAVLGAVAVAGGLWFWRSRSPEAVPEAASASATPSPAALPSAAAPPATVAPLPAPSPLPEAAASAAPSAIAAPADSAAEVAKASPTSTGAPATRRRPAAIKPPVAAAPAAPNAAPPAPPPSPAPAAPPTTTRSRL
jgi:serine/threonine-protein kinase